jgi:ketosteroid isomerase-like protein
MPTPVQIVEALIAHAGDDEQTLEYFADDAEVAPISQATVLRGRDEIRRYAAETRALRPELRGCIVHEAGDSAVVLTTLAFPRTRSTGESYTEVRPVGFVVETRDGKVVRMQSYETWSAAREAGDVAPDAAGKRLSLQGLLAVARELVDSGARRLSLQWNTSTY